MNVGAGGGEGCCGFTARRVFIAQVYVSGSTGISAFLRENHLFVANVGDSRAVLGRKSKRGGGIKVCVSATDVVTASVCLQRLALFSSGIGLEQRPKARPPGRNGPYHCLRRPRV